MTEAEFVTREQFVGMKDSVSRHITELKTEQQIQRKFLFGNGEPGIDEKLRIISDWVQAQKEKEKDKSGEIKKYVFWAVTFVLSEVSGILIALYILGGR